MTDIKKHDFIQPFFGSNYIEGSCKVKKGSLLGVKIVEFKIWFTNGGYQAFLVSWRENIENAKSDKKKYKIPEIGG